MILFRRSLFEHTHQGRFGRKIAERNLPTSHFPGFDLQFHVRLFLDSTVRPFRQTLRVEKVRVFLRKGKKNQFYETKFLLRLLKQKLNKSDNLMFNLMLNMFST